MLNSSDELEPMDPSSEETALDAESAGEVIYALNGHKVIPGKRGLCFAACASGLYRSDDGGTSWNDAYITLKLQDNLPTTSVILSPQFDTDHTVIAGVPGGILRSVDGGKNWGLTTFPTPPPTISALAFSPQYEDDSIVFAGTMEDGVLFSTDEGRHWVAWNFGLLDLNILCLNISPNYAHDDTVFVGVESGLFRSTNGGRAWREVVLPFGYEPVLSMAVSPNYAVDSTLFIGTESQGLWRSSDGGKTWSILGNAKFGDNPINALLISPQFGTDSCLGALTPDGFWISTDGGTTWKKRRVKLPDGEAEISALYAPTGLDGKAPLLAGLVDGQILVVK